MARRGRPPYPRAKLRSHKTLVALTAAELATLKRAAGSEPLAVYLRRVGLQAARRQAASRKGERCGLSG